MTTSLPREDQFTMPETATKARITDSPIIVWRRAWDRATASGETGLAPTHAFAVYFLASKAGSRTARVQNIGEERLAELAGMSVPTWRRAIKAAIEAGWVRVVRRSARRGEQGRGVNCYVLTMGGEPVTDQTTDQNTDQSTDQIRPLFDPADQGEQAPATESPTPTTKEPTKEQEQSPVSSGVSGGGDKIKNGAEGRSQRSKSGAVRALALSPSERVSFEAHLRREHPTIRQPLGGFPWDEGEWEAELIKFRTPAAAPVSLFTRPIPL